MWRKVQAWLLGPQGRGCGLTQGMGRPETGACPYTLPEFSDAAWQLRMALAVLCGYTEVLLTKALPEVEQRALLTALKRASDGLQEPVGLISEVVWAHHAQYPPPPRPPTCAVHGSAPRQQTAQSRTGPTA